MPHPIESAWFPVRCCCTPRKVLGFIRLSAQLAQTRSFYLADIHGVAHPIELRRIHERKRDPIDFIDTKPSIVDAYAAELAVYSDDRSVEFWRTIPDFMEAYDAHTGETIVGVLADVAAFSFTETFERHRHKITEVAGEFVNIKRAARLLLARMKGE